MKPRNKKRKSGSMKRRAEKSTSSSLDERRKRLDRVRQPIKQHRKKEEASYAQRGRRRRDSIKPVIDRVPMGDSLEYYERLNDD